MANIKQLKHLEHLEDEMLNYGVDGCMAAVSFLKELRKMLGHQESSGFMQTKWDGAPSVICGMDPLANIFFVGTKSVFNKDTPKICYSEDDVDEMYSGDLAEKLKFSYRYFSKLGIKGVIQGDLLFTSDIRRENVNGEQLYTFRPNTITYGIPVDHPIGKAAGRAKIGVVFHTHYQGTDLPTMQAMAGAPVDTYNKIPEVLVVKNDTPMDRVGFSRAEMTKFDNYIIKIERMCKICGDFLDELVGATGTTGDAKFHIASYLKQFFNNEIKNARSIGNIDESLYDLANFYHEKMSKELAKIKTPANLVKKRNLVYQSENYLVDNVYKFKAMLTLYKELQAVKQMVIDKLDHLEEFRTFVQTDKGYKVTTPEGYVLHKDGSMIKFVNRLEFAYNNFTLQKQWR
ncbi:hypothetical cyanophage protein [Synechococcus phage S-RSM4]|uniref:Hypothetical cyanophage protein n=4 Tax=root TaxID=1 RepID=C7BV32_9CAUD|nr:hypothetical cyanophage protein [Synechococcus phage S-RSM4]CAR63261.1 hypothetical cyanophage protein [Synechococcus phage S-RSM4]